MADRRSDPTESSAPIDTCHRAPAGPGWIGDRIPRNPPALLWTPATGHLQGQGASVNGLYNPPVDLTCAACTAPAMVADNQGNFDCDYCGTHFVTERTECPACGELNLKGADNCSNCGEPLSIVASVIDRQGSTGNPLWIRRLQSQVADLKESEARASEDRFEEFVEIDRRRKAAEAEAYTRQKQTDRNILFYGAAAVLLIVLVILVLVAIP